MFSATMPTKPAAIHSIVSMNRSIHARFMSAPAADDKAKARRMGPPRVGCELRSFRQRVVLLQRGTQFAKHRVRIAAVLLDALAPGLGQRFGGFLPQADLLGRQLVDLVAGFGLDLVDAGILHLAPMLAEPAG